MNNNRARISILLLLATSCTISQAWLSPKSLQQQQPLSTALMFPAQTTTCLNAERRFAQPNTKKQHYGADSKILSINKERIRTAGRVGTKRFVDPCKVFIGNLPFSTTEKELAQFVLSSMGQSRIVLHSAKIIHDWKTGKSKGYGFVQFADPIYATVCMDVVNGKMLNGRALSVSQGKKKEQENEVYLKKNKKKPETDEEAVISSALDEAESEDDDIPVFNDDLELDAQLFGIVGDDEDDDEYDGIFLERKSMYEEDQDENLNREQRRDAARRRKRQKLPSKGFG